MTSLLAFFCLSFTAMRCRPFLRRCVDKFLWYFASFLSKEVIICSGVPFLTSPKCIYDKKVSKHSHVTRNVLRHPKECIWHQSRKNTLAKRPSSLGPKHQLQIRWSHNYRSQYATDLSHWLHLVWTPVATVRIWSGRYFCWIYRFEIFNFQPVVWVHNQLSKKIQLQEIGEVLDLHVIDLGDVLFGRMSLC